MRKVIVGFLLVVLIITFSLSAEAETKVSGSLKTDLVWDFDADNLLDEEVFNLVLQHNFGFDADIHVDLQANSYRAAHVLVPTEQGLDVQELSQTTRETEMEINRAYVNYYTKEFDWRLGKQEINWGSAYELQPTNYFNPYDLRGLDSLNDKIGITAIQGTYYGPENIEVTGVLTPFFDTHRQRDVEQVQQMKEMKKEMNKQIEKTFFTLVSSESSLDESDYGEGLAISQINMEKVADKIENAQGGIKFTKRRLGNSDISLSAYQGRDKMPAVDVEKIKQVIENYGKYYGETFTEGENPATFSEYYAGEELDLLIYPEATRIGFDVIVDLGQAGAWTELTYSFYEDDQFADRLETAAGFDRRFGDLYLVGQYYHRSGRLEMEDDVHLGNIYFDKPVGDFHELEVTAMYETESETYFIQPQFNYSLADSTVLKLGGTYAESEGEAGGMLDSMIEKRVYARLEVDF